MAHLDDYLIDVVQNSWTENNESAAETALTVTHVAEANAHHAITKVDASYSSSTQTGLLQVLFGSTVKAQKYIHGAGAIDFGVLGLENPTVNDNVSATLAAGAATITGTLTLTGYKTGRRAGDA